MLLPAIAAFAYQHRGKVFYDGKDLLDLPEPAMREIRGNRIAMMEGTLESAVKI